MMTIGLADGIRTPSSFFLMVLADQVLMYADCAVNPDPDAEALADIAIASAASYRALMQAEPRVAMLSFSTKGSASHPRCEQVLQALEIAREREPELAIDGELQADAALISRVARKKSPARARWRAARTSSSSPTSTRATSPTSSRSTSRMPWPVGPILQGFAKPVSDLSRGATVDDVVATAAVLMALA
jgi:phosphate acetyltransferase